MTAAVLMHDPTTKGRLHCMPLMSTPVDTPLAPPDQDFWQRVTVPLFPPLYLPSPPAWKGAVSAGKPPQKSQCQPEGTVQFAYD